MKAIVTGASSGIGLAVAHRLAVKPWNGPAQLVITGRTVESLECAAKALRAEGAEVVVVPADMADVDAPQRVVDAARSAFGGLDVLISNAGMVKAGALAELSLEDYERMFAVNTRATWLLAKAAYPMLRQSRGAIVATSSLASEMPATPLGMYSASKAAVVMMIKQMAVEWGADGIRCNCVSPGSTFTGMTEKIYSDPEERAKRERGIALHRIGKPEDMANAIAFLAGPESAFITGENLLVDGGSNLMLMSLLGSGAAHQKKS